MRILYISGGSAGHLAPLVAVERALKSMHPEAQSLFACTDKPEDAAYLKSEGVTFRQLPLPTRSWSFPFKFIQNELISRALMLEFKPDVVFSKGGAVSVPACRAAKKLGIPVVLHESDAVMGRANGMVARWATKICMGFPANADAVQTFRRNVSITTGNPIRPNITQGSRAEGLRITRLSGTRPIMFVLGGSQGAESLNAAVREQIDAMLEHCDVIHLSGKGKKGATPREGYWTAEFAHAEIAHLYAIASFALSRAGAGSISELAANGVPTILVPIEGLANDHQVKNAEIAAAHGGCVLLRQKNLMTELLPLVKKFADDSENRAAMSAKIRTFQQPDAARRIAEILVECIAQDGKTD